MTGRTAARVRIWFVVLAIVCCVAAGPAAALGSADLVDAAREDRAGISSPSPAGADPGEGRSSLVRASRGPDDPPTQVDAGGDDVRLTQALSLVPDRPGVYGVTHRYRLPDQLRRLAVTLPDGASVVSTTGFVRTDAGRYEWDRTTASPRIAYRLPANQSTGRTGPIAGPGDLTFVDVGSWALVSRPVTSHSWAWVNGEPAVGFEQSLSAENGAVGDRIAYLGPYTEYTHTAHGQQFRLIVPEAASLSEPPERLFASLSAASDQLRVGDRDGTVFVVAAPTTRGIQWGVRGLQTGDADMWVRDVERLDDADNVWLHEYVHTRQAYAPTDDLRWTTEGVAAYYAALLSLEQERITFEAFRDRLAAGERPFGEAVLARPGTWEGNVQYHLGALVAGDIDRRLRLATDGSASFQEVFRSTNARDAPVSAAAFRSLIGATGGDDVASLTDRYVASTARPAMWTREQHREAFGDLPGPARITYALSTDGGPRVAGPYRNRTLPPDGLTLVPGERLAIEVVATNFGDRDGTYAATLRVDDAPVETRSGTVRAGDAVPLTFEYAFDSPGLHTLSVGDATLRVTVREPAAASVTSLSADRTTVSAGDRVSLVAVVANDADYPAAADLRFTRNGEPVAVRTVRLDAGESRTVTVAVDAPASGTAVFGVENATVDPVVVRVESATAETTASDTPGFGIGAAVVALLLSVLVGRRRGRR